MSSIKLSLAIFAVLSCSLHAQLLDINITFADDDASDDPEIVIGGVALANLTGNGTVGDAAPCTLCPWGGTPSKLDRVYQIGDTEPISCQDMVDMAQSYNENCWAVISWDNTFDWQSFCGCPSEEFEEPKYVCGSLCPDDEIEYRAALPSYIAPGASCKDFAELHPYLLDEDQCGGEELQGTCCVNVEFLSSQLSGAPCLSWFLPALASTFAALVTLYA